MAYQALPRELPGPATLRRRPRGVVGQGEPQKLNQPAPDGPDWNQAKRGIRLGPGTGAAPDRATEATSGKAGDGRHCSRLSGSRFAANAGCENTGAPTACTHKVARPEQSPPCAT